MVGEGVGQFGRKLFKLLSVIICGRVSFLFLIGIL